MSCLRDASIADLCLTRDMVTPFDPRMLQPASYELTFDGSYVYKAQKDQYDSVYYEVGNRRFVAVDDAGPTVLSSEDSDYPWVRLGRGGQHGYELKPFEFYIASSKEYLRIPSDVMSRFEGKSTLGRAGLMVHVTAGYIDPGFEGNLTLEIMNISPWIIVIKDGDKIGQLSFHRMDGHPDKLYGTAGNHYQGQRGATLPR